jgi:hypothetical protein
MPVAQTNAQERGKSMKLRRRTALGLAALLGAVLVFTTAGASFAGGKYGARGPGYRYITAQSKYNNGTISAPIRPAQYGWQVRLPGGAWIYCELNCFQTLRDQTIDFYNVVDEYSGD